MSQHSEIRKHMQSGKSLTQLQALNKYGCFRLSSIIQRLRREGLSIHTKLVGVKQYAKYKLA